MPPPPAEESAGPSAGSEDGAEAGQAADRWPGDEKRGSAAAIREERPERTRERVVEASAADKVAHWQAGLDSELFHVAMDNRGGGISSWTLLDPSYTVESKNGSTPIELVTRDDESTVVLSSVLEGLGIGNLKDELFRVESADLERVVFAVERGGIEVRKIFEFDSEGYAFDVTLEIANNTNDHLETDIDLEWPASMVEGNDFREQALIALANGEVEQEPVVSVGSGGFFSFLGNSSEGPSAYSGLVEWAGVSNRYFLAALIPSASTGSVARVSFEPVLPGKRAVTRFAYENVKIKPGQIVERNFRAYMGPKLPEVLAAVKPGLERSIDFGYSWLEPLTRFFHALLTFLYGIFPNYGVAIILVTLLVRLVTLPIMQKQMKSMERMRELQPRLKEIQEQFKEDRQKQSEAQMKLYKDEGVNPLGGCLPMLLQFPVFIGLFYALQSTIALRHAPFALWITDLSAPEELFEIPGLGIPVRVLPIVMGASMFIQQRMTPMTGMDPVQARMMTTVMPLMMLVLFYQFPSGLVLYWMISNFLGIGHQLWVRRRNEAAAAA